MSTRTPYKNEHGVFPTEGYIVDVMQNPGSAGDYSGNWFSSQLRSCSYFSYGKRRLASASEHLLANGWNVDLHRSYPCPLAPLLSEMPEQQLKAISGNGMNLQTLAAWFLYVGMSVERKEGDKFREEQLREAVLKKDSEGEASDDDDAAEAIAPQDEDGEDREEEKKETDHEKAPEEEEEQSDD